MDMLALSGLIDLLEFEVTNLDSALQRKLLIGFIDQMTVENICCATKIANKFSGKTTKSQLLDGTW